MFKTKSEIIEGIALEIRLIIGVITKYKINMTIHIKC